MSEYVSRIQVAEATYDIKDKNARNSSQINEQIVNVINESVTPKIEELEEKIDKVSNGITSINKTIKPDANGNIQLNAEDVNAVHKSHVDLLGSIDMAGHVKLSEGNIQIELKEGETIIPDADKDTAASLYDTQQMGIALNNKIDSISGGEGCIKSVNGQKITPGDPQGRVIITGEDIPFSKEDDTKLKDVIESLDNSRVIPNSSETPTEPLVNLQIGATTYKIQGSGSGSSTHKYSTEEKVIGEWIDGKPVYEKTFNFTGIKDNIFNDFPHNCGSIATINITGMVDNWMPINCRDTDGVIIVNVWIAEIEYIRIQMKGMNQYSTTGTNTAIITLQYTKTTD